MAETGQRTASDGKLGRCTITTGFAESGTACGGGVAGGHGGEGDEEDGGEAHNENESTKVEEAPGRKRTAMEAKVSFKLENTSSRTHFFYTSETSPGWPSLGRLDLRALRRSWIGR